MIALAGPNLPHAVLAAAGCHAGAVPLDLERATPRAHQWVESKFAPWAFPLVEAWAEGEYDHLDGVLFSRAEDTSQRLYYYLCELQRRGLVAGPRPMIFDVAKVPRDSSRDRTVAAVRALMDALGVNDEGLEAAIVAGNAARPADVHDYAMPTCLLYGTPAPDMRLHQAIAAAGFAAVGDTLEQSWLRPGPAILEGSGDPAGALGAQLHAQAEGSRSFADPAARLQADIAACRAQAVVLWRIEEDEAQTWQLPAERRVLDELGLPVLVLNRRDWFGRDGAAGEIAVFLKGLNS